MNDTHVSINQILQAVLDAREAGDIIEAQRLAFWVCDLVQETGNEPSNPAWPDIVSRAGAAPIWLSAYDRGFRHEGPI